MPLQLTIGFIHSAPYFFPLYINGSIWCVKDSISFLHSTSLSKSYQNITPSASSFTIEFLWLQVNHYAATFFEYCREYEKALACYELAIRKPNLNYPAEINYINLKMKISHPGSYSPVFHFNDLLSKYRSRHHVVQTLCHRGFYLYK